MPDWWSRPQYVCYNLNIGSVIAAPAHDEVLPLPQAAPRCSDAGSAGGGGGGGSSYTLRGFAHTGAPCSSQRVCSWPGPARSAAVAPGGAALWAARMLAPPQPRPLAAALHWACLAPGCRGGAPDHTGGAVAGWGVQLAPGGHRGAGARGAHRLLSLPLSPTLWAGTWAGNWLASP